MSPIIRRKTPEELWASSRPGIQVGRLDAHICGRFGLKPRTYKNAPDYPSVKRYRLDNLSTEGRKMLQSFLAAQRVSYVIMSNHAANKRPPAYDAAEAQQVVFK